MKHPFDEEFQEGPPIKDRVVMIKIPVFKVFKFFKKFFKKFLKEENCKEIKK